MGTVETGLGPDPDLGLWLAEVGEYRDVVTHAGPDDGRDPGQLCWDVLEPTGLLHPHCGHCKSHYGPKSPQQMAKALDIRIPSEEVPGWIAATLLQSLVYPGRTGGELWQLAVEVGEAAVVVLGPDADWRINGCSADRSARSRYRGGGSVTEATFDAAVVGIGGGHSVVVVATGED
jgi:hypothetical protein